MRLLRPTETKRGSAPVTPNYIWGREGGQKYAKKKCYASFEWPLKTLIVTDFNTCVMFSLVYSEY